MTRRWYCNLIFSEEYFSRRYKELVLLSLIYTNSMAAGIFIVACLIWMIPETIATPQQMAKAAREKVTIQDRGSMVILIGLQWIGLFLNFILGWLFSAAAMSWHRTALFGFGIVFILFGVALRWYAIWTLGQYFTRDVAVSTDQQVVQRGPYRFIRHPAYSGTLLTMLGIGLAVTNWASLVSLLICTFVGHLYRVNVEEKALVQAIGQPYVQYIQHTRRFIPWIF
jgi:protein-S-isoprenylcysteine O-methyltransferase Ste14